MRLAGREVILPSLYSVYRFHESQLPTMQSIEGKLLINLNMQLENYELKYHETEFKGYHHLSIADGMQKVRALMPVVK